MGVGAAGVGVAGGGAAAWATIDKFSTDDATLDDKTGGGAENNTGINKGINLELLGVTGIFGGRCPQIDEKGLRISVISCD
jgi:hypothetical protein